MLRLYHAPFSRASRFIALLEELAARDAVTVETVGVARADGTGGADPRNPHPEGKVPLLVHDGVAIWESPAIALYLTELFPEAGLGRPIGAPDRGRLLSWLAWSGGVLEPVVVHALAGIEHPVLQTTFRGLADVHGRIETALAEGPYLMGGAYSVADLMVASTFQVLHDLAPAADRTLRGCRAGGARSRPRAFDPPPGFERGGDPLPGDALRSRAAGHRRLRLLAEPRDAGERAGTWPGRSRPATRDHVEVDPQRGQDGAGRRLHRLRLHGQGRGRQRGSRSFRWAMPTATVERMGGRAHALDPRSSRCPGARPDLHEP